MVFYIICSHENSLLQAIVLFKVTKINLSSVLCPNVFGKFSIKENPVFEIN
jgi:hypothetical protein